MQEMDICLQIHEDIQDLEEDKTELILRAWSPKNQIITGMPKGSGIYQASENYLIKLENIERKIEIKRAELVNTWNIIANACNGVDIEQENISLLFYRFYKGYMWKQCIEIMSERYPNSSWNENKGFRVFRSVKDRLSAVYTK